MKLGKERYFYVPLFLSILFLIALIAVGISYGVRKTVHPKKLILFDVGSTKTQAYLFDWENSASKYSPKLLGSIRCGGAITDVIEDPQETYKYYSSCLEILSKNVSAFSLSNTFVYSGSTGGVRSKCKDNSSYCDIFRNNTIAVFSNYGFGSSLQSVEVIDGVFEALYGFLAANAYLGHFDDGSSLEGTIDLGGQTFEVAHEVTNKLSSSVNSATKAFYVEQRNVKTFLQEVDCIGTEAARLFYEYSLIKQHNFNDPCLPDSVIMERDMAKYNTSCNKEILDDQVSQTYNKGTFRGTGDLSKCLVELGKVFGASENCQAPSMCLRKKIVADTATIYRGMSTFQYTSNAYKLNSQSSIVEYTEKLTEECFGQNTEPSKYCFQQVYSLFLVQNIMQLGNGKLRFITDETIIGWPVGKAFSIKNLERVGYSARVLEANKAIAILIAFGILLAASLIAAGILWYTMKDDQTDHDSA